MDILQATPIHAAIAELIGVFVYVFSGCLAAASQPVTGLGSFEVACAVRPQPRPPAPRPAPYRHLAPPSVSHMAVQTATAAAAHAPTRATYRAVYNVQHASEYPM